MKEKTRNKKPAINKTPYLFFSLFKRIQSHRIWGFIIQRSIVIQFQVFFLHFFKTMSLLSDLINLDLSGTTEKIIAEYIWFVTHFLHSFSLFISQKQFNKQTHALEMLFLLLPYVRKTLLNTSSSVFVSVSVSVSVRALIYVTGNVFMNVIHCSFLCVIYNLSWFFWWLSLILVYFHSVKLVPVFCLW